MEMLSEDDLNLKDMTDEELGRAWDLWFTFACWFDEQTCSSFE